MKCSKWLQIKWLHPLLKLTHLIRLARLVRSSFNKNAPRFARHSTAIGQTINSYLTNATEMDDRAIHLLFSANRWEAVPLLKKSLLAGSPVVCDRYGYSGVAFSAAKNLPGMDLGWCKMPDVGLPKPDCVIFLTLKGEEAEKRGGFGDERYEKTEMQEKVRDMFKLLSDQENCFDVGSSLDSEIDSKADWFNVDASGTIEEVQKQINRVVDVVTARVEKGAPLRKMFSPGDFAL